MRSGLVPELLSRCFCPIVIKTKKVFQFASCCDIIETHGGDNMDINSLDRFVKAQEKMFPIAIKEIQNGKKRSHWMWYIFPQLRGLGISSMAHKYGIINLDEAKAYLEHPVLSGRLYELCGELLKHKDKTALEIFGDIDEMKLKSSMTLFALTNEDYTIFDEVLESFFGGEMDEVTVKLING